MFLTIFLGAITPTVSHISFRFFVIKRIIFGTLSNILEIFYLIMMGFEIIGA